MRFGSKKMIGSSSSMAAISRPFASYGLLGITTFTPQMCVKMASGLCECVCPPRMPPPQGARITTGEEKSPALR